MSDNYDSYPDISNKLPDFGSVLAQRIVNKNSDSVTSAPAGTFDPYKELIKKKQSETAEIDPSTIKKWPDADVKKLQDYCEGMGIPAVNSGRMHPIAMLALLKQQYGDCYKNVPLEERIPIGYEKIGTHSGTGGSYPYTDAIRKKQILHG